MTVLIDTGIFIAFHNTKDINHDRAVELVREIVNGKHGAAFTTDYIFDEAVTTALVRTGKHEIAVELGNQILGVKVKFVNMIQVDLTSFSNAWRNPGRAGTRRSRSFWPIWRKQKKAGPSRLKPPSKGKKRKRLDAVAAAEILEAFLEQKKPRNSAGTNTP